jgi:hypothetical protein
MDYDVVEQKMINISSSDGILNNGSYKSNINFNFANILSDDGEINYVTAGVLNAQIPVSFYTINYTNNTLVFKVNTGSILTITLTRGNYNSNSLITALTTAFALLGYTFTIVTDRITGIMTFTSTGNSFTFYGISTLTPVLGFTSGTNVSSSGSVLTATYPLNLLGIKRLKVNSSALSTVAYDSKTLGQRSSIASISVNVPSYNMIDYVNTTNAYAICQAKIITYIDIQILDEADNYVNFNNTDWTMTLQINVYRRSSKRTADYTPIVNVLSDIRDELAPAQTDDAPTDDTPETDTTLNNIEDPDYNAPTDNDLDLLIYNGEI